ncbi:MAG: hypothetical protein ACYTHJ_05820 [Planctomycetota bacterium]
MIPDQDISLEIQDALASANSVASTPCIHLLSLDSTQSICGTGRLNVFCVDSIELKGDEVITLDGSASDIFIFNVAGRFELLGGSKILAGG